MVRLSKATFVLYALLVIPLFLGFQLAARPVMFCGIKVCDVPSGPMACAAAGAGEVMVRLAIPPPGSCGDREPTAQIGCGGCGQTTEASSPSSNCKDTNAGTAEAGCCTDPVEITPAGCCSDPVKEIMSGCRFEPPVDATCSAGMDKGACDMDERSCGSCMPICSLCIPSKLAVEPVPSVSSRLDIASEMQAPDATLALMEAERKQSAVHSHSPPLVVLARPGPQLRIDQCSYLL